MITVYASASLIIIELVNNVIKPLNLPQNIPFIVIVALVIGFPIVIALSWIFDVTPKGIKKTESISEGEQIQVKTPNSWRIATYISVVIIIGMVLVNVFGLKSNIQKESHDFISIAVLPFTDLSPQKDQEYFCDGMAIEIINSLSFLEELKVVAKTSSFAFKGKNVDVREIGQRLNVGSVLDGSIRKDSNQLRITVQLINVADGTQVWSSNFNRELEGVFDIQDEIALAIVENLKVNLLLENKNNILTRYTNNFEAYNFYLRGMYNQGLLTPEGIKKAIYFYEQAIDKDPKFALAYVELANVYQILSYGLVSPEVAIPKAEEYIKQGLELDNELSQAFILQGLLNMNHYWRWEKSENNYKKSLELNPNDVHAFTNYSVLLTYTGRNNEAIELTKRALELDPLNNWVHFCVGWSYYYNQQYEEAINAFRNAASINPADLFANYYLGKSYKALGDNETAIATHEHLYGLSNDLRTMAILTYTYYEAGRIVKGRELYDKLAVRLQGEYISPTLMYLIYRARGEIDLAFEWFEKAINQREGWIVWIVADPYESQLIPDEARFRNLIDLIGLPKNI
jgi:serine/threonine-protein kinase